MTNNEDSGSALRQGSLWTPKKGRWADLLALGAFAAILFLQIGLVVRELITRLPVYATYADPAYSYLLAGTALVSGGTPGLIYHPGIPLQLLLGLTSWATSPSNDSQTFFLSVARDPELHLLVGEVSIALCFIGSLLYVSIRQYRYWGMAPAFIFQLILLYGLPLMGAQRYQIWPESLLVCFALITIGILSPQLVAPQKTSPAQITGLVIVSALGLTTKILFVPMIVLCLFMLKGRPLLAYVLALPVTVGLLLLLVRNHWTAMHEWFTSLLLGAGRHGQYIEAGPTNEFITALASISAYLRWFPLLLLGAPIFLALVKALAPKGGTIFWRSLVGLTSTVVLVLAPAFKDSQPRDFLLLLPLLASMIALASHGIHAIQTPRLRQTMNVVVFLTSGLMALTGIFTSIHLANASRERPQAVVRDSDLVDDHIFNGTWGLGYNVWTEANALLFGSNDTLMYGFELSDDTGNAEIRKTHPNATYFDFWGGHFLQISSRGELTSVSCQDLVMISTSEGLGIILESEGHVPRQSESGRITLAQGTAAISSPMSIGRYYAYELSDVKCH